MIFELINLFILSIFLSLWLIFLVKKIFYKLKILDNPKKYNLKRKAIPYSTGITFFISFFILSYFFLFRDILWDTPELISKLILLWSFWFVITFISFFDDLLNVSPKIRLFIQILIWAVIWITSIKIWYISNIFWWIIDLQTYNINIFNHEIFIIPLIFTIIWYVFIFNSLNWTDWIRGNTAWISIISFFILFCLWFILYNKDNYIWWKENAKFIMEISIILIWILIPYFYFDIKNKILMWDSWTMFLAFMLASLAIIAWWKIATVLVVFWLYSVDAIYVIYNRLKKWKNPLSWDFTHFHHRLLKKWFSQKQVLILIFSLSIIFWISALFLNKIWKIIIFWIIVLIVFFINKIKFINFKGK